MSSISTHVLDTSSGKPAAGIRVHLFGDVGEISSGVTNADGRCPALVPQGSSLSPGTYHLSFDIVDYFPNGFYPEVTVSFQVHDASAHYHVPLLISPFGYTTYRGS
jgi:5-hydroxyisourate hydrolase